MENDVRAAKQDSGSADVPTSRRRFLGQVAKTLGVGLGIALIPTEAFASTTKARPLAGGSCCKTSATCGVNNSMCVYNCQVNCSSEGQASPATMCPVCVSCSMGNPCFLVPCGYCG